MVDTRVAHALSEVVGVLEELGEQYRPEVAVCSEGRVVRNADHVLRITGLSAAQMDEIIEIDGRVPALVLGLRPGELDAVALDTTVSIEQGARVRSTGRQASIGVGEALLGRVIDPLGRPLDGLPLQGRLVPSPVHRPARPIYERARVHTPLFTGALVVDAMFPIGRGQRELILGDEGTGKTALALDAILRQRDTGVVGVYVAVGRRRSETWRAVKLLQEHGGRWVVVAASEDMSAGMRVLAPYAGATVAEYFAERGEHALVVYDDLTAHAVAWRELSLLLRRPPGREAYPGDVFYLHSRLLERATQLSLDLGGGSVTALPIASLESGRLSAYIPTNLISITDGQIVLSAPLFVAGQRPAVDAGLSVSRIGARAQPPALRGLAARLRLEYASFLEIETFSRLGTRLEPEVERRLAVGRRVRALLRAPRLAPLSVFDEVLRLVLAADPDALLKLAEDDVAAFVEAAVIQVRQRHSALVQRIEEGAVLTDADHAALTALLAELLAARPVEESASGEEAS